ncbi:MAG: hypothetical protein PVF56_02195 [Desulfobacterales bacterium]
MRKIKDQTQNLQRATSNPESFTLYPMPYAPCPMLFILTPDT